jgi:deoxyribose-phosphate aldolase
VSKVSERPHLELARHVQIALVKPEATRADVERFCAQARDAGCQGVCVNGSRVELACALLEESPLKVTGLVGFPLGATDSDVKRFETETAIDHGAQEIELVLNVGRLKDGDLQGVLRELRDVAEAADERTVRLVLQTHLLSPEEIATTCELALDSGVRGIVTSTGLPAALVDDIKRLRQLVGNQFEIKAAAELAEQVSAQALIDAGASRLGFAGLPEWARHL